jgi:hypothetical protein
VSFDIILPQTSRAKIAKTTHDVKSVIHRWFHSAIGFNGDASRSELRVVADRTDASLRAEAEARAVANAGCNRAEPHCARCGASDTNWLNGDFGRLCQLCRDEYLRITKRWKPANKAESLALFRPLIQCAAACAGCSRVPVGAVYMLEKRTPALEKAHTRAANAPPGPRAETHCNFCGDALEKNKHYEAAPGGGFVLHCTACRHMIARSETTLERVYQCPDSCTGCRAEKKAAAKKRSGAELAQLSN